MNAPFEYKQVVTGDGSPTLSLGPTWEHMHALEGAFTETQYIYQPTVAKAFQAAAEPVILSLGLGLAYNEMLAGFEAAKSGRMPASVSSYESVTGLREAFSDWLRDRPSALADIYTRILFLYEEKYGGNAARVKNLLSDWFAEGKLRLLGPVENEAVLPASNAVLFDPFSSKTSPELWTEEFLDSFFNKASARTCFVSTYACKGELKRALRKNGFTLSIQKGFGKKRHSIFAERRHDA